MLRILAEKLCLCVLLASAGCGCRVEHMIFDCVASNGTYQFVSLNLKACWVESSGASSRRHLAVNV